MPPDSSIRRPPRGIYVVAAVFFLYGLICLAPLLRAVFDALGWKSEQDLLVQPGLRWVLVGGWLGVSLLCYGIFLLVRLHPAPRWVLVGMTLFLATQFFSDATGSPFYSPQRIYLNRAVLLSPLVASCVYLFRPGFQATCQAFRATPRQNSK